MALKRLLFSVGHLGTAGGRGRFTSGARGCCGGRAQRFSWSGSPTERRPLWAQRFSCALFDSAQSGFFSVTQDTRCPPRQGSSGSRPPLELTPGGRGQFPPTRSVSSTSFTDCCSSTEGLANFKIRLARGFVLSSGAGRAGGLGWNVSCTSRPGVASKRGSWSSEPPSFDEVEGDVKFCEEVESQPFNIPRVKCCDVSRVFVGPGLVRLGRHVVVSPGGTGDWRPAVLDGDAPLWAARFPWSRLVAVFLVVFAFLLIFLLFSVACRLLSPATRDTRRSPISCLPPSPTSLSAPVVSTTGLRFLLLFSVSRVSEGSSGMVGSRSNSWMFGTSLPPTRRRVLEGGFWFWQLCSPSLAGSFEIAFVIGGIDSPEASWLAALSSVTSHPIPRTILITSSSSTFQNSQASSTHQSSGTNPVSSVMVGSRSNSWMFGISLPPTRRRGLAINPWLWKLLRSSLAGICKSAVAIGASDPWETWSSVTLPSVAPSCRSLPIILSTSSSSTCQKSQASSIHQSSGTNSGVGLLSGSGDSTLFSRLPGVPLRVAASCSRLASEPSTSASPSFTSPCATSGTRECCCSRSLWSAVEGLPIPGSFSTWSSPAAGLPPILVACFRRLFRCSETRDTFLVTSWQPGLAVENLVTPPNAIFQNSNHKTESMKSTSVRSDVLWILTGIFMTSQCFRVLRALDASAQGNCTRSSPPARAGCSTQCPTQSHTQCHYVRLHTSYAAWNTYSLWHWRF